MKSGTENYNKDQKLLNEEMRGLVEVLVEGLEIELMNKKKQGKKIRRWSKL